MNMVCLKGGDKKRSAKKKNFRIGVLLRILVLRVYGENAFAQMGVECDQKANVNEMNMVCLKGGDKKGVPKKNFRIGVLLGILVLRVYGENVFAQMGVECDQKSQCQ